MKLISFNYLPLLFLPFDLSELNNLSCSVIKFLNIRIKYLFYSHAFLSFYDIQIFKNKMIIICLESKYKHNNTQISYDYNKIKNTETMFESSCKCEYFVNKSEDVDNNIYLLL